MVDDEGAELGLVDELERGPSGLPHTHPPTVAQWAKLVAPGWRGPVSELCSEALTAFWGEAVRYARWEIGRYTRWQEQDEPVLADGYDAEGLAQAAFERLLCRDQGAGSVLILYTVEGIRHALRTLIKHRVRWLHERSERRLVVGEWDVLPPRPNGELVSIFDYLPGGIPRPDEELMRKEKEQLLSQFKIGFEGTLEKQKELLEVFGRVWDGQKRREMVQARSERVKALQAQLRRRLVKFCAEARGGVAEMLEGLKAEAGVT